MPPYKCPKQTVLRNLVSIRFADAEALLKTKVPLRLHGAIYMAGYGIECALKARICADRDQDWLEQQFWHHDLRKLAQVTRKWAALPADDPHRDALVVLQSAWDVQMRYALPHRKPTEVLKFIEEAKDFATWLLQS